MISVESQVLARHFPLFSGKTVLLAGGMRDDFAKQLQPHCKAVRVWSWYFDYANRNPLVDFALCYDHQVDLILYYWTKNKQECQFQLNQLLAQAPIGQEIIIIGENRCGVRSAESLLSPYGQIGKIDSARRCGLYHFQLEQRPAFNLQDFVKQYQHPTLGDLTIMSLPGVFSANELDQGTALLLSTLKHKIQGNVLDIGCGAGVIGSFIKQKNPHINLTMTDIHAMALESAKRTLTANQLTGHVFASDVFSHLQGKFDLIISNPPFHDGIDTAYRAVTELIQQAKWYLVQGGELRLVANAFLPYPDLLDQHFGTHQVLAQTGKFKVYSVRS